MADTLLISKENNILIVGKKPKDKAVEVINAFTDEEAEEIWNKLVTAKEKNGELI